MTLHWLISLTTSSLVKYLDGSHTIEEMLFTFFFFEQQVERAGAYAASLDPLYCIPLAGWRIFFPPLLLPGGFLTAPISYSTWISYKRLI